VPRRPLVLVVAAGHSERRLAVDEVEAGFWDDYSVILQVEATLSEGLALAVTPLQLEVVAVVAVTLKET